MRPLTACSPPAEGDVEEAAPAAVELSSRLTLSIESEAETRLEFIPAAAAAVVEAFLRNDCSSTTFKNISKMLWYSSRFGALSTLRTAGVASY